MLSLITGLGRAIVWVGTSFPLSERFLDEDYRQSERAHLDWGLRGVIAILIGAGCVASLFWS